MQRLLRISFNEAFFSIMPILTKMCGKPMILVVGWIAQFLKFKFNYFQQIIV